MAILITAVFRDKLSAEVAAEQLLRAGFSRADISLLMSETTRGREFAIKEESKAPEGIAIGSAAGGILGAIVAAIATVGALTVPGVGLLAAGPILAAFAGAGMGGAAGGIMGGLIGAGVPEHEAKFYGDELHKGGILVGIHTSASEQAALVKDILRAAGGEAVKCE